MSQSALFGHFFKIDNLQLKASCLLCPPGKKPLAFTRSSKSNLWKHVSNVHPADRKEALKAVPSQTTIQESFAPYTKQEVLTDKVVNMVVQENLPMTFVDVFRFVM